MKKQKEVKIGDVIFVEEAWEDEQGNYHDEYARVKNMDEKGEMMLDFFEATADVQGFLEDSDGYMAENFEPVDYPPNIKSVL